MILEEYFEAQPPAAIEMKLDVRRDDERRRGSPSRTAVATRNVCQPLLLVCRQFSKEAETCKWSHASNLSFDGSGYYRDLMLRRLPSVIRRRTTLLNLSGGLPCFHALTSLPSLQKITLSALPVMDEGLRFHYHVSQVNPVSIPGVPMLIWPKRRGFEDVTKDQEFAEQTADEIPTDLLSKQFYMAPPAVNIQVKTILCYMAKKGQLFASVSAMYFAR